MKPEKKISIAILKKNLIGYKLVKDGKKEYLAVLMRIPKRGGGVLATLSRSITQTTKQALMQTTVSSKLLAPAVASFLLIVGWELVNDVMAIARKLTDDLETDESTTEIIKKVLSTKYPSPRVAIKKLLTFPIFEAILVGLTMKKLSSYDPTGISNKLIKSIDEVSDSAIKKVSDSLLTCPTCLATGPDDSKTDFENPGNLHMHISSHTRKPKKPAPAPTVSEAPAPRRSGRNKANTD